MQSKHFYVTLFVRDPKLVVEHEAASRILEFMSLEIVLLANEYLKALEACVVEVSTLSHGHIF